MIPPAALIFGLTYAGMALGRVPRLTLDRTGIALLGAIAMVLWGGLDPGTALQSVHLPTLLLLYGLMIVSAQLRLGGFYTWLALHITRCMDRPERFLFQLMLWSGLLASVLANDIICLAFTPVLCVALRRRGLNPLPYLLGLAMATNLGSAATIIGNPQSMLIGQLYDLNFTDYLLWCAPPSILALLGTYALLRFRFRGRWRLETPAHADLTPEPVWPAYDSRQTAKGLLAAALVLGLLLGNFPRTLAVLTVAGGLLLSRRLHTRDMLGLVDWHLITLFCGLFIVGRGMQQTGLAQQALDGLATRGFDLQNPFMLALGALGLSNLVSNVPATVLLTGQLTLPSPELAYVLSLSTTYAGNLLTLGSLANLIVIEQAGRSGTSLGFRDYLASGLWVTLLNFAILAGWIFLRA